MPDIQPITCSLCLMGEPVIFRGSTALHGYKPASPDPSADLIVCADSNFFPDNLPVAIKVATA